MARFVSATIDSVLAQDYPAIEYIIVDGGSTDGTVEILRAYAAAHPGKVHLILESDNGPAEAIEKGLYAARGEIFSYCNADDTLLPGAVSAVVQAFAENPEAAAVYGDAYWVNESGRRMGVYPTEPFDAEALSKSCYICQPACFLRTEALRAAGGFDRSFHVAFDYELWLRLSRTHSFVHMADALATSRMYRTNKTMRQRGLGIREAHRALLIHRGYVPFGWVHTYASYLMDGRDLFFEPLRPSCTKYLFALLLGLLWNYRSPLRFWREWYSVMSLDALHRRWNEFWLSRRMRMRPR